MADDASQKPGYIELTREAPADHFIRTLESDSATLKSGGKPDFMQTASMPAPAQTTAEDVQARAAALSTSDTIDLDAKPGARPTPPALPKSIPVLSADMMPIDRAQGKPVGPGAPQPIPIPAPAIPVPVPPSAAPLHTYTSDFNDEVTAKNATPTTILAAEQDAAAARAPHAAREPFNIVLIGAAIVLVLLGAGGAYYTYQYSKKPTTVAVTPLTPARIFVDERQQVSGEGAALAAVIAESVHKPLASGGLRLLSTSVSTSTGSSVFSALQEPAPDILLRNISALASLAGIVNVSGTQSPFFILAVQSYSETFAGMLQWEARLASDLTPLYPLYPPQNVGTSTAVSAPTPLPAFNDEVVTNHDTRVLRDTAGHSLIIYGYWDEHTLVLARDEGAFTEIIGRLANSRTAH